MANKMFRNVINAAALTYAGKGARLVDEGFPFVRMPVKPRAEIATSPVQGPACNYVEVPVVLRGRKHRIVKINPENMACLGIVA
jgi:hypothetical protein